ncbi:O-antigen ligase family protein [Lewinella sp. IMCC34183]|uniref:O-antigen ligase family protein n=1 Tax=Lewinella sp. IMCC34183 TaxID=2248762 RepID=UPI000E24A702|nr:O-antigen ligase family protein [Lewinella sp. IMCC34183]
MNWITRLSWADRLVALGIAGLVFGLVLSPAVLSISVIVTVAAALLFHPGSLPGFWRHSLPPALRSSLFWGLTGLYLLLLLGAPQTCDWTYYLERLRVKLPLLMLPLAWAARPFASLDAADRAAAGRTARTALLVFLALVLAGVLINYALHFTEINVRIGRGQPVPVPRDNHIRFSLLLAIGAVLGLDGAFRYRSAWQLGLCAFLFLGLHLLAVRSGLLAAYAGWAVVLAGRALRAGRYGYLAAGLLGMAALPVLAYLFVPSFRTKADYTRFEVMHRGLGRNASQYSDEGRFTSVRLGLQLWREHPVIGVGPGNLRAAMDTLYATELPGAEGKRPHNQFVTALAGGGLVGGVLTLCCFAAIGYGDGRWRQPVYAAVFVLLTLSCLVENTLESSVGVSLFTFFLLAVAYPPWRKPG